MSDTPATLFAAFDRGRLSRRQLLQALGSRWRVALPLRPARHSRKASAAARARARRSAIRRPPNCRSSRRGGRRCCSITSPARSRTIEKEAAYYAALMNWKIRSDDGKQAMLDIGDWGGLVIRGGYQPPPPAAAAPPAGGDPAGGRTRRRHAAARPHRGVRRLLLGHRAVGREDGRSGAAEARAESGRRQRGRDFQSFHVKDPDGFDLQISNGNRRNRRQGAATAKVSAPAPFAATTWKTVWLDHISFETSNYKETGRVLPRAAGLEAGRRRRQPEHVPRSATSAASSSARGGGGGAGCAARADAAAGGGPQSVTSRSASGVRSGSGEGRAREARAQRARGHRRQRRHPHRAVQELSHDDAERIRSADQQHDREPVTT